MIYRGGMQSPLRVIFKAAGLEDNKPVESNNAARYLRITRTIKPLFYFRKYLKIASLLVLTCSFS
jgi:hypothetical protein